MEGKQSWLLGTLGVVVLACAAWWFLRPAPEMSGPGYQYAMALFSVCNRQDTGRLEGLMAQVAKAESAGEITARDARWLASIMRKAEKGRWSEASASVRKLMELQVKAAPALP